MRRGKKQIKVLERESEREREGRRKETRADLVAED